MNLDRTDDQSIFEEFLFRLSDEQVRSSPEGYVEIRSWQDVDLDTPLRLQVSPRSLAEHLRMMERDGKLTFPDEQPIVGALQLFLVHLDEAIRMRRSGETELVPYRAGVKSLVSS